VISFEWLSSSNVGPPFPKGIAIFGSDSPRIQFDPKKMGHLGGLKVIPGY
jgi:hypothetical protein